MSQREFPRTYPSEHGMPLRFDQSSPRRNKRVPKYLTTHKVSHTFPSDAYYTIQPRVSTVWSTSEPHGAQDV